MNIDYTEFERLEKDFKSLDDTNPNLAFSIRKRAAALQDYYGQIKATMDKGMARNQLIAKGKESEIKREYIEKSNVSRGREEYLSDPRVLAANEEYYNSIEATGKLESLIKYLNSMYYIAQSVYDKAGRGGNYN